MEEIVVRITDNISKYRPVLCSSHPLTAEHTWPSPCNSRACRQVLLGTSKYTTCVSLPLTKCSNKFSGKHPFYLTVKMVSRLVLFKEIF